MRRKSFGGSALALLAASLVVAPSWAGGEKGSWELGLFGGYAFLDEYSGGSVALDPDDDALFGARVGWFASPAWSIELSWQQLLSDTGFPAPTPNVSFDIDSIRINGLYNFRPGACSPNKRPFRF